MTSLIADLLELLDTERRCEFEERAGTIEFDGGMPRDDAECLALIDLLRSHPAALLGVTALEVDRGGSTEFVLTTDLDTARDRLTVVRILNLGELIKSQFGGLASLARF